jgi:peptidoglycan/LPS O-acetylase OafA/YrhL
VITKKIYPGNFFSNLLVFAGAYFLFGQLGLKYFYSWNLAASILAAVVIVNNIFPSEDLFYRILNSRILVVVGLASYSIYVWQQVFLLQVPWEHAFKYSGTVWFNLIALSIVSFCSYYIIERRLAKFKSRFR